MLMCYKSIKFYMLLAFSLLSQDASTLLFSLQQALIQLILCVSLHNHFFLFKKKKESTRASTVFKLLHYNRMGRVGKDPLSPFAGLGGCLLASSYLGYWLLRCQLRQSSLPPGWWASPWGSSQIFACHSARVLVFTLSMVSELSTSSVIVLTKILHVTVKRSTQWIVDS